MDRGLKGFGLGVIISLIVAIALITLGASGIMQFAIASMCILIVAWFTNSKLIKKDN